MNKYKLIKELDKQNIEYNNTQENSIFLAEDQITVIFLNDGSYEDTSIFSIRDFDLTIKILTIIKEVKNERI